MRNSSSISYRPLFLFLLFLLIITTVYSPVLYFDYLFHDDAFFWVKFKEIGFKHFLYNWDMSQCRFGLAWLLTLENFFIHKVSDLKFLRFFAIVISSCTAYLLLQQMRRLSFSDIQAFLVISAMFFLPGFAVIIFNSACSCIHALCIFLACWSFHRIETDKGMVIPVFSFLFAITIYQPAAMFYWVMVGMYILFVCDRHSVLFRKNIFRSMAVGLISLLIYAILIFFMHYSFSHKMSSPLYNPYVITPHWLNKLQWFSQEPIKNALNLWDIFPKVIWSILVSGFIVFTALVVVTRRLVQIGPQKRHDLALTSLWQPCLFIFIFFLTFLPNLVANENVAFYRCLLPLTSLIWLVLVWAILKWMDIMPKILTRWRIVALLSTIVVLAGIETYHNVLYYRVLPSYVEWNAYKSMAKEIRFKKVDAIHIFLPYNLSIQRYDEFGVITSAYRQDLYHMLNCAFNEAGMQNLHPFPLLYLSFPDGNTFQLNDVLITKLPNGRWVYKDTTRDEQLHEFVHSGNTLDYGVFLSSFPLKSPPKRKNRYILNLNDFFSASNYNNLIK